MLTEVPVYSSELSLDTGPGTMYYVGEIWGEKYN